VAPRTGEGAQAFPSAPTVATAGARARSQDTQSHEPLVSKVMLARKRREVWLERGTEQRAADAVDRMG